MDFDGEEFKPRETLALPQVLEIPNLRTLIKNRSKFELISHNVATRVDTNILGLKDGTDISIELNCDVKGEFIQLYRSHSTREQRNLLAAPYFSPPDMSPILRDALLARYSQISRLGKSDIDDVLEANIAATIEKNKFDTKEERQLAGYHLYDKASMSFVRCLWQDAYRSYQQASEILWPLIASGVPSILTATMIYISVRRMVEIWQRQKSFESAETICKTLVRVSRLIKDSDPEEPDFQRMWAGALFLEAVINVEVEKLESAVSGLVKHVEVLHQLFLKQETQMQKIDWLESLSTSIKISSTRNLPAEKVTEAWKEALKAEIDDEEAFNALTIQHSPTELPVWLKDCTLEMWPTKPLKNSTLRYSLRIPSRWATEKTVRGTDLETEHLYHGSTDSEFLIIAFQEAVTEHSDMTNWITFHMMLSGFPILCDLKKQPELLPNSWHYMGTVPSLTAKLKADETHAYIGVAKFEAQRAMFGRIYVVLVRKGTFAWKIALCFATACLPGMKISEKMLNENDHNRAGAVLGSLQLVGP
jgi:hypothetical protein